jgi:hypothetical protein
MKGSPIAQGHDSSWFNELGKVEQDDIKHLAYVPNKKTTIDEDGDCEVFRNCVNEKPKPIPPLDVTHVEADLVDEDLGNVAIIE